MPPATLTPNSPATASTAGARKSSSTTGAQQGPSCRISTMLLSLLTRRRTRWTGLSSPRAMMGRCRSAPCGSLGMCSICQVFYLAVSVGGGVLSFSSGLSLFSTFHKNHVPHLTSRCLFPPNDMKKPSSHPLPKNLSRKKPAKSARS